MLPDLPLEEWPSALEELENLDCLERFWLARYEPIAAWCEYQRFLADGRKPN